jgi:hypothetical protein
LFLLTLLGFTSSTQSIVLAQSKQNKTSNKDRDGIDGRMKGPHGEIVYIGPSGGRYYINASGNKVYIPYGKNKTKKKLNNNIKKIINQATK